MFHLFSFKGPFNAVISLVVIVVMMTYAIEAVKRLYSFLKEPQGAKGSKKFWKFTFNIVVGMTFLTILAGLATIRDQQNTSKAKEYLYLTPDVIPGIKNILVDSMSRRDSIIVSSINTKLVNYTTFGDIYGVDSAGNGLRPLYLHQSSQACDVDSAGNVSPDTSYKADNITAVVPAVYLASTGGKLYTAEWKRDTVFSDGGNYASIIITYQLVYQPTTATSVVTKPATKKLQEQKTSEYKSEDQKAIEEGLKDGSLIRLPNGDVVIKPTDEPQKKVEASKKPARKFRF